MKIPTLKSIALRVCSRSLLNFYDDGKEELRNYLVQIFLKDDYGEISLSILEQIIEYHPTHLTSILLYALIPENTNTIQINSTPQITGCNILNVLRKCRQTEIFNICQCEQLMLPALFSIIGGLLNNLHTVNLSDCRTVNNELVQTLLKNVPSLRHVDISNCGNVTDKAFLLDIESQDRNLISQKDEKFEETCVNIKSINISSCGQLTSLSVAFISSLCGPTLQNIDLSCTNISCTCLLYLSGYSLNTVLQYLQSLSVNQAMEIQHMEEILTRIKLKYTHSEVQCDTEEGLCECLKEIQQKVLQRQLTYDSISDLLSHSNCDKLNCDHDKCCGMSDTEYSHINMSCETIHQVEDLEISDVRNENTLKEVKTVGLSFQFFIPSLKSIYYSDVAYDAFSYRLDEQLTNSLFIPPFLQSVQLYQLTFSIPCLQNELGDIFISTQTALHELNLSDESLMDSDVLKLSQLPLKLHKLDFTNVFMLTDVSVIELISDELISINLSESSNITDITLKCLAKKSAKSLKLLDLSWCEDVTEKGIDLISTSCTQLEHLNLRHCNVTNPILFNLASNCRNITVLNLSCIEGLVDEAVIEIAKNLEDLQEIDISWNSEITDKSIVALFSYSQQLITAVFTGNKRISPEPMYLLVTDLGLWEKSQKLKKLKREIKQSEERKKYPDYIYDSDEEEEEELYEPKRSTIYGSNIKNLDLGYVDGMNDDLLAWIVAFCFNSIQIIDYYNELVIPARFRVKNNKLLMPYKLL